MHPRILAQRRAQAMDRLVVSATGVADKMGLEPDLLMRIRAEGIRDTNIANLTRLEATADMMELIAKDYGVKETKQQEYVINEFIAPPTKPEVAPEPVEPVVEMKTTRNTKTTRAKAAIKKK